MEKHNGSPDKGPQHPLKSLTPAQFMALGGNAIVYVRPILGADLSGIVGNPDLPGEQEFQLVVGADGTALMVADSEESVADWLSDKNLGIVTVH